MFISYVNIINASQWFLHIFTLGVYQYDFNEYDVYNILIHTIIQVYVMMYTVYVLMQVVGNMSIMCKSIEASSSSIASALLVLTMKSVSALVITFVSFGLRFASQVIGLLARLSAGGAVFNHASVTSLSIFSISSSASYCCLLTYLLLCFQFWTLDFYC